MIVFSKIRPIFKIWILIAVFYSGSLMAGFVWLDHTEIVNAGYRVESGEELAQLFSMSLDSYLEKDQGRLQTGGGYWRPLHALSVSLDWKLWGAKPLLFHLENIFWHLLVVTGLYSLGLKILPGPMGPFAVFWGTLMFAVHPLGVHSVTWISGRKDVLCALFAILSLRLLFEMGRAQRQPKTRHKANPSMDKESHPGMALGCGFLMLVCAYCSFMSKEAGLVIPALAIAVVYPAYKLRRRPMRFQKLFRILAIASLCLASVSYVFFRIYFLQGFGLSAQYPEALFLENGASFCRIAWHNVRLVLLPGLPSISDAWVLSMPLQLADLLAIAGVIGGLFYMAKLTLQRRAIVRPILWYIIWIVPVCGLIPLNHMFAERYLYPASWGLLVALCYGLHKALGVQRTKILSYIFSAVCLYLGAVLFVASLEWGNDKTLFEAAVERDPNFIEGHIALGNLELEREAYQPALSHYEKAIKVLGTSGVYAFHSPFVLHTNAGLVLKKLNEPQLAAVQFLEAFKARPNNDLARYHLAMSADVLGNSKLAQKILTELMQEGPKNYILKSNLGFSHLRSGDYSSTISLLEPLVKEKPDDAINRMNLASAYLATERWDVATEHLLELADQKPEDSTVLAKLAWSLWMQGEKIAAAIYLEEALLIDPKSRVVKDIKRLMQTKSSPTQ